MTTHITKTWFDGGKVVTQEIHESEVYKQEPVAWQYRDAKDDGTWSAWLGCDKRLAESTWREVRPLYTTPPAAQPCPTCEALARTVMMDQTAHDTQRQPQAWIAVDECMPEPGAYVLAVFRYTTGKQRVIRAMHAPRHTLSEDDYGEFVTEGADYDEATDTTYWPEGWYECNENEETHWQVHEEVTHWMPLPASPSVGEKPDAA